MRYILISALLLGLFMSFLGQVQAARPQQTGVGFVLGQPSGVAFKHWRNDSTAIAGGAGWSLGSGNLRVYSDYLWHKPESFYLNDKHPLDLYFGGGLRLEFEDEIGVGVRIPVGLAWESPDSPLDVFVEVAPVFEVVPDTAWTAELGIGFRIYF